jgi:hypothetical protein
VISVCTTVLITSGVKLSTYSIKSIRRKNTNLSRDQGFSCIGRKVLHMFKKEIKKLIKKWTKSEMVGYIKK